MSRDRFVKLHEVIISERIRNANVNLAQISSDEQAADGLTKALREFLEALRLERPDRPLGRWGYKQTNQQDANPAIFKLLTTPSMF